MHLGYGNVAPTTTICQVFTMVYGAFGIPLFLITIADIGRFFKTFIMFIIQRLFGRETLKKSNADRHLLREIGEVGTTAEYSFVLTKYLLYNFSGTFFLASNFMLIFYYIF